MKRPYISPELEFESIIFRDVILSSIIQEDETFVDGGVVIDPDDELLD